jgi:ubiquinone/menaquinone biosynthesis C-methylase UbiE
VVLAVGASLAELLRGRLWWAGACALVAFAAGTGARIWSRRYPGPMPHVGWWTLLLPRGPGSPRHLKEILEPKSGERMLEVGPGIGVHALPIASSLLPDGRLDALDVQQEMLDDLERRAGRAGVANIITQHGEAEHLPYANATFDAAYLVSVLGEIPDEHAALCELKRVLKRGGRLVVGEFLIDPDFVSPSTLEQKVAQAGFALERRTGSRFAYFARFRPLVLLAIVAALASGCTALKRFMYEGWGRDSWQEPERVVRELALQHGNRVADLGAGGGYFTFRLADAVGPDGRVYAVDVDEGMLEYVSGEAKDRSYDNVETILASHDDPRLPADGVDMIFTCDTYHHLADRSAYFRNAARYLRPGGRVAVIDFDGKGWFVRTFGHFTAADVIRQEMEAAGYRLEKAPAFIDRQSFQIFVREE